jgi:hypothetical protein
LTSLRKDAGGDLAEPLTRVTVEPHPEAWSCVQWCSRSCWSW